ncbi:amidase family protein [Kocuria rhizophila]|nr:amidase family protein [Kocuria rhizophila]
MLAGMPTSRGSPTARGEDGSIPRRNAGRARRHPAGQRSRAAGKTQAPEFLLNRYSENRAYPPARNPLCPGLPAGGSSGGQAAAVAAGTPPAAIGSDGGGSGADSRRGVGAHRA